VEANPCILFSRHWRGRFLHQVCAGQGESGRDGWGKPSPGSPRSSALGLRGAHPVRVRFGVLW